MANRGYFFENGRIIPFGMDDDPQPKRNQPPRQVSKRTEPYRRLNVEIPERLFQMCAPGTVGPTIVYALERLLTEQRALDEWRRDFP